MTAEKRDLLIHYDEESGKLIFYSSSTLSTAAIRETGFDGVCPEVEHFKRMPPDEAERTIGGLVFSPLDLGSVNKIRIREYESEAETAHARFVEELEKQVKANDAEAQYHLFIHLHSAAMKTYSFEKLARAEAMLFAVVAQGNEEAKASLESWPTLKAAAQRRINHGPVA